MQIKGTGKFAANRIITDDGIIIGPQNSDDDRIYKTSDELISNYRIVILSLITMPLMKSNLLRNGLEER